VAAGAVDVARDELPVAAPDEAPFEPLGVAALEMGVSDCRVSLPT
jgi:hypothetical protein